MLVLDSTIGCIETSGADVLDLYSSIPAIIISEAGPRPSSMEAFVCAIKEKTRVKVYLALVADNRRIYVYTKPGKPDSEDEYKATVREALAAATSMGFAPEPVDLSCSPAMKEVIVRNTKILRLPGSKVAGPRMLKHGLSGAPTLPSVATPKSETKPTPATSPTQPSVTPFIPVTPPIPVAIPVVAPMPTPTACREAADADQEMIAASALSELQKELQEMRAEKDAQADQLQQLTALHKVFAVELGGAREECARLTAERDELAHSKKELESVATASDTEADKIQELTAQYQAATTELERAREEAKVAATERDAAAEKLQEQTAWQLALTTELETARQDAKKAATERDAAAEKFQEQGARQQTLTTELEAAREDAKKAATERDAAAEKLQEQTARHQALTTELETAREDAKKAATERDAAAEKLQEQNARQQALTNELEVAREDARKAATERDAAAGKLQELTAQQLAATTELMSAREECARLTEEKDALLQTAPSAEQAASESVSLKKELGALSKKLEDANRRNADFTAEGAALADTVAKASEAVKKLTAERDKALKRVENLTAEQSSAGAQNEARSTELASVCAEKDAALSRVEELEQQKAGIESELDLLRKEVAVLTAERETLLEKSKEWSRLGSASTDADHSTAPVRSESAEPSRGNERRDGSEGGLGFSSARAEEHFGGGGSQSFAPEAEAESAQQPIDWSGIQAADFTPLGELQDGFFSAADDDSSPVRFTLQTKLRTIEYVSPDEVVDLQQSVNNAFLSPEGKGQENCEGYICGLRKGGARQVYVAIYGVKSERASVYVPEAQPEDDIAYARTIRGAISFAEEVGLMMESVKLDPASKKEECLKRCPVLKHTA